MQNDKRNAMNEYVQRIENFSLLCMCSAQRKEERQVSRQWKEITTRPRECFQATLQRTASMCVCVCACVWADLLELGSAYLRCTMHSLLLPTPSATWQGEAKANSTISFFFFMCKARKKKSFAIHREGKQMNLNGEWLNANNNKRYWKRIF